MDIAKRKALFSNTQTELVILNRGVNEDISSLEMGSGELLSVSNYYLTEGSSGGLVSTRGYERFDGQPSPSLVPISGELLDSYYHLEDYTDLDSYTDIHEPVIDIGANREAARALIQPIPGIGPVLGLHYFNGELFAFRTKIGGVVSGMYKSSPTGWQEVDTSADPLEPGGKYRFIVYNFLATSAGSRLFWTNSVGPARSFDGTVVTKLVNSGMGVEDKPQFLSAFKSRLFLSYTGGSVQASSVGDPGDWVTDPIEFGVGFDVTDLSTTIGGTLVIFGRDYIKTLVKESDGSWTLSEHSNSIGAIPDTIQEMFGTLIFMSDFGVTTLAAAQEYGGFATNTISQGVKKTLQRYHELVIGSSVIRDLNQYRLYFSNGLIIVFSFSGKKFRGATYLNYPNPACCTAQGTDSEHRHTNLFGGTTGYVFVENTGTSFDGLEIKTSLKTAYYHYKSPRNWKSFTKLTFETASYNNLELTITPRFDYRGADLPQGFPQLVKTGGLGTPWGDEQWGEFLWASSDVATVTPVYFQGIGTNLSINISSSSKYNHNHIVLNFIVDYLLMGKKE